MIRAPVLFLIFNRPDITRTVMDAIREYGPSRLYIGADGPRDRPGEDQLCSQARQIATTVDWSCQVQTLFRDEHLGCCAAVSNAITWFFENEPEGIVLEDDCLPHASFFHYCSELLAKYRDNERVMSICGGCYAAEPSPADNSYTFARVFDPWGWASWRRAWRHYNHSLDGLEQYVATGSLKNTGPEALNCEGYWRDKLMKTKHREVDAWCYRWTFSIFKLDGLVIYPSVNLVSNLGFREDATHTFASSAQPPLPIAALDLRALKFPLTHPERIAPDLKAELEIYGKRFDLRRVGTIEKVRGRLAHMIKAIGRRLLGEHLLGRIDYYRFAERRRGWGGPFNGQKHRTILFHALMRCLSPAAIIETGTHLGATTEYLAAFGCQVYSVEESRRTYGFAKERLCKMRNVILLNDDSHRALRQWLHGPLRSCTGRNLLFYLDAHWNAELPLAEELEFVFSICPAAVVMVDDFQVPDDPGYGYDDYGSEQTLTLDYIASTIAAYNLAAFYPATHSADESGERRGCIVVTRDAAHGDKLSSISLLRPALVAPEQTPYALSCPC